MADKEKTRVTNFIRKQAEIDLDNIREVAEHYKQLDEISKLAKKEMDVLKKVLIEVEVSEYFPEDEMKVVFEEGKKKTYLDSDKVFKMIGLERFLEAATVSETSLKNTLKNDERLAEKTIAEAKVTLEERTSPSIKIGKMTKKELQEMV